MKKLLIGLAVLVVLALAVDRGGDLVAQNVVAGELQDAQDLDEKPDVDITGFPFLTQLARNEFDRVEVSVRDVPLGGGEADGEGGEDGDAALTVSRLDAVFSGVTRDGGAVSATRARADALIDFDDLGDALGIDLAYEDDESLRASKTFDILGQSIEPSITVAPEVVDGALGFAEPVVDGVDDVLSSEVVSALADTFGVTVPLAGMPFDIEVDDLRVERDGLHLLLRGQDLAYG